MKKRITVWTEFPLEVEKIPQHVLAAYPDGMANALADIFRSEKDYSVSVASIFEDGNGLSEERLENTDVLIYWAHALHGQVEDETVERVVKHVNKGMGIILLHSAHDSKLFKKLLGTTCNLTWREIGEYERVWIAAPYHPIAQGVENGFVIEHEEMYGEPFDIPQPETNVFIGWFEGGEVFRSGVTYTRGYGKVFYFQPGHETFPVYRQAEIKTIIKNAAEFVYPTVRRAEIGCPNRKEFMKR